MKDSAQKLTRHKRIVKRRNTRKNNPPASLQRKRERRDILAEIWKDAPEELELYKPRRWTYLERIKKMELEERLRKAMNEPTVITVEDEAEPAVKVEVEKDSVWKRFWTWLKRVLK